MARGPEAQVEAYLSRKVALVGGWTTKFAPTKTGVPDRLVVLPGGIIHIVELKAADGELSERQRKVHDELALRDYAVPVLYSKADVDAFIARVAVI